MKYIETVVLIILLIGLWPLTLFVGGLMIVTLLMESGKQTRDWE